MILADQRSRLLYPGHKAVATTAHRDNVASCTKRTKGSRVQAARLKGTDLIKWHALSTSHLWPKYKPRLSSHEHG